MNNNSSGSNNTSIGWKSLFTNTTGSKNTAIGNAADVTGGNLTNATAIGYNAKVGASNSLVLGGTGADAVNVGIGTQTPSTTLEVNGQVKISGGSPGLNKVLTSDGTGLATWASPTPPSPEVAYIYNLASAFIAPEDDIPFDTNGSLTAGFIHTPGSTTITILNTGMYKVNFSVSGAEPNQFTLFLNGIPIPGSTYGSGAGTQQNNGQVVFFASAFDIITLRNHSSSSSVNLLSLVGGTESSVNASIIIQKL
ncbi:MAG: collagen-like protein [Saprospiraceae bacterium]|uniref:Collagen-like protein n=1 Tax=Candidatus Opimibacter skivensis TaxID=2982028 RepID=A0A9D7XSQ3_9BACT|nr:collagen-like protein [Candidatus Opimibacter skivensis]